MPVPLTITDLGTGAPVIVLHGLFGRRRNWQGIQKQLARDSRIVTADMRNHGDSPWQDTMTYDDMAEDIAHLIDTLDAGPATVIGHSMGGKAAMVLALRFPDLVKGMMVLDIAPVDYTHDYTPYIEAMRAVPLDALSRRSEADTHLKDAIADPGIRAFLLQNLTQDDDGIRWQVNLDAIDRDMGAILGFETRDTPPFDGPVTFLAGGASDYVNEDHHEEIARLFPAVDHETVDGAGHWVHAEKPAEVMDAMRSFIEEVGD